MPKEKSTSSKSEETEITIPESWQWVTNIIDEAHLPHLALPVKWDTTKAQHTRVAYDPATKNTFVLDEIKEEKKEKKHKSSPIGFITATAGKNPMPGTQTPDAVRKEGVKFGKTT